MKTADAPRRRAGHAGSANGFVAQATTSASWLGFQDAQAVFGGKRWENGRATHRPVIHCLRKRAQRVLFGSDELLTRGVSKPSMRSWKSQGLPPAPHVWLR